MYFNIILQYAQIFMWEHFRGFNFYLLRDAMEIQYYMVDTTQDFQNMSTAPLMFWIFQA